MTQTLTASRSVAADWEEQSALLFCWPHQAQHLALKNQLLTIIEHCASYSTIVIACHDAEMIGHLAIDLGAIPGDLRFLHAPNQHPWVRDFGPISCHRNESTDFYDFQFNGWGKQADGDLDNRLNAQLDEQCIFQSNLIAQNVVFEGGGISSDGLGNLLVSTNIAGGERNPNFNASEMAAYLRKQLQAMRISWIDPLYQQSALIQAMPIRFANENTLAINACSDPSHPAYVALQNLRDQASSWKNSAGKHYQFLELPFPKQLHPQHAAISYTSYLLSNRHVFVPQFNDEHDHLALDVLQATYPNREAIPLDALSILEAGGSLHSLAMPLFGQITF